MPTQAEIEASARVLCRIAYYQLPPNEQWREAQYIDQALGNVRTRSTARARGRRNRATEEQDVRLHDQGFAMSS